MAAYDSDASLTSSVGALARDLPVYASSPPIEAVVFAWGVNEDGQLGLDGSADVLSPKVVEALLGTRLRGREFNRCPLVAGSRCTLAIDAAGRVLSWGWNARGTLGHGGSSKSGAAGGISESKHGNGKNNGSCSSPLCERKPRRISALSGSKIVQAATGGWHCLALDADGAAWAWGGNEYSQCGSEPSLTGRDVSTPVRCVPHLKLKQVAAGGMSSAVLTVDGEVWCWGEPWGDFSVVMSRAPRLVPLPLLPSKEFGGAGATVTPSPSPPPPPQPPSSSAASPAFFSPSSASSATPSPYYQDPLPFSRPKAAKLACGAFHTLALLESGGVMAWGINDFGQLGNSTTTYETTPARVVGLPSSGAADIAAGGWHSLALSKDGEVFVWGRGEYGRLGLGDPTGASRLTAEKVRALEGIKISQASAGGTHTAALSNDGRLFTWGRGSFGRLGTGDERDAFAPVEVTLPGGGSGEGGGRGRWRVVSVACGGRHTVALALPSGDEDGGGEGERDGRGFDDDDESSAAPSPSPPPPQQQQRSLTPPAVAPPPSSTGVPIPSPSLPSGVSRVSRRTPSVAASPVVASSAAPTGPVFDSDGGVVGGGGGGGDDDDEEEEQEAAEQEAAKKAEAAVAALRLSEERQGISTNDSIGERLSERVSESGAGPPSASTANAGVASFAADEDEAAEAAEEEVENASLARTPPGGVAMALARSMADAAELEAATRETTTKKKER